MYNHRVELEHSHFVLTQLHSSVTLDAGGRQSFSCACWNPHNDCTQLLTGVDNAIKAWDLCMQTSEAQCIFLFLNTTHYLQCTNIFLCARRLASYIRTLIKHALSFKHSNRTINFEICDNFN